jgi:hypothetical protein
MLIQGNFQNILAKGYRLQPLTAERPEASELMEIRVGWGAN